MSRFDQQLGSCGRRCLWIGSCWSLAMEFGLWWLFWQVEHAEDVLLIGNLYTNPNETNAAVNRGRAGLFSQFVAQSETVKVAQAKLSLALLCFAALPLEPMSGIAPLLLTAVAWPFCFCSCSEAVADWRAGCAFV